MERAAQKQRRRPLLATEHVVQYYHHHRRPVFYLPYPSLKASAKKDHSTIQLQELSRVSQFVPHSKDFIKNSSSLRVAGCNIAASPRPPLLTAAILTRRRRLLHTKSIR